jgi:Asp-tRNA(Asn)/Glu-tRNA(Gln) amidotransferase A subunit family amidase
VSYVEYGLFSMYFIQNRTLKIDLGYPLALVPLNCMEFNGRPFGLVALTTAHNEAKLIHFMSAWESTFPKRPIPSLEKL